MATKMNKAVFVQLAIIAAALIQISTAQSGTTHVVGDAMGWVVPSGDASAYSSWAANNTFKVGDTLVFNFANGRHDVAEVTKAAFDACNTASPIMAVTNSPANIVLNSTGEHYYICRFTGHCANGQKLAVNVTSSAAAPAPTPSSPAPQPSTPSPVPTPTPTPKPTPTPTPAPTPTSAPPTATPPTATPPTATPPSSTGTAPSSTETPPAPTTPSPSSQTTPPSPGNSAKSLGVALSSTFLAIFVGLLY